ALTVPKSTPVMEFDPGQVTATLSNWWYESKPSGLKPQPHLSDFRLVKSGNVTDWKPNTPSRVTSCCTVVPSGRVPVNVTALPMPRVYSDRLIDVSENAVPSSL